MRCTSPAAAGPCHSSSVALPRVQVVGGESRTRDSQLARTSGEQRSSVVPRRLRAREDHTGRVGSVSRSRSGPGSLSDAPPRSKTPRPPRTRCRTMALGTFDDCIGVAHRYDRAGRPAGPHRTDRCRRSSREQQRGVAHAAGMGPKRSIVHEGVHQASTGTSPRDGRTPTPPLNAGGRRMDACVSVPSEPSAMPLTTEITGPPEEPPGMRSSSPGLRACSVVTPSANSCVAALPAMIAPASYSRATAVAAALATRACNASDDPVVGIPATSTRSLMLNGMPSSGPRGPDRASTWSPAPSSRSPRCACRRGARTHGIACCTQRCARPSASSKSVTVRRRRRAEDHLLAGVALDDGCASRPT